MSHRNGIAGAPDDPMLMEEFMSTEGTLYQWTGSHWRIISEGPDAEKFELHGP